MNLINDFCLTVGILKGVQVLVVDNDRDSRDLYAILLKDLSANVITAGSVKEALEILSWFTPNIIVCEIRFLGESIYTLLSTLNAIEADNGNHIPIIVTSTSTTGTCEQIPDVEFEEYLLKPLDLDKFVSTIMNQVQKKVAENFCHKLLALECYSSGQIA
ncbi:MAG: response regulator [Nostoc sp. JL34]|uniref:response regulator n=1 Tax=Nostoc sp. JL34 TaxID=2815397 RepID=UPI001D1BB3BE|nr:response regulator [Nostoc sp. JL34]MBN3882826.1 response regulator [Nostoc sp. JL34]